MEASEFYQRFKEILRALGTCWPGDDVMMSVKDGKIYFEYDEMIIALKMPKRSKAKETEK